MALLAMANEEVEKGKMKYFFDTEFIEDGKTIDLISIGIVAEDGRKLYRQNVTCHFDRASDWVMRNVFPHLLHFNMRGHRSCGPHSSEFTTCKPRTGDKEDCPWAERHEIVADILEFCNVEKYGKPEFWGYYADYDWVVFCQLFGRMIDLPTGYPMYCRDIKQAVDMAPKHLQGLRLPVQTATEHHALYDAEWTIQAFAFLKDRGVV